MPFYTILRRISDSGSQEELSEYIRSCVSTRKEIYIRTRSTRQAGELIEVPEAPKGRATVLRNLTRYNGGPGVPDYPCLDCSQEFGDIREWRKHGREQHYHEPPHLCPKVGCKFLHVRNHEVTRHIKREGHQRDPQLPEWKILETRRRIRGCGFCVTAFNGQEDSATFTTHVESHLKEGRSFCQWNYSAMLSSVLNYGTYQVPWSARLAEKFVHNQRQVSYQWTLDDLTTLVPRLEWMLDGVDDVDTLIIFAINKARNPAFQVASSITQTPNGAWNFFPMNNRLYNAAEGSAAPPTRYLTAALGNDAQHWQDPQYNHLSERGFVNGFPHGMTRGRSRFPEFVGAMPGSYDQPASSLQPSTMLQNLHVQGKQAWSTHQVEYDNASPTTFGFLSASLYLPSNVSAIRSQVHYRGEEARENPNTESIGSRVLPDDPIVPDQPLSRMQDGERVDQYEPSSCEDENGFYGRISETSFEQWHPPI
ncbi:hypothetical protein MMC25_002230 [Agyrium rufum]|nr:hypothetical protein [Agyrium rufum]